MKLYKGIFYTVALAAVLTGCSKEDPFVDPVYDGPTGTLMTRCLAPTLTNVEGTETRAAIPSTDDFNVVITRKGGARDASGTGTVEYKYSEMPEILTLPVGDYKVYAHHGDNKSAAWDEPYYYGESEFGIDANKITDEVEPIVAKLSNIRVTIVYHPSLLSAMSDDSKVEVKAGTAGTLTFSPGETRSAYFKYVNASQTLAATFTGIVDGAEVVQTKTHANVKPGNHYRITFRVHGIDPDEDGDITGTISVDANVEVVNKDVTINGEQEEFLEDDWRPNQGNGEGPVTPPVGDKTLPTAIALEPTGEYAGFDKLDLNAVNEVTDHLYCAWKVVSEAEGGFQAFTVDIISNTLTPEELEEVHLASHLDLINPGQFEEGLSSMGFPVKIGGQSETSFDITGFLTLMQVLGEANHEFKLTVTDANGTSIVSVRLHND